MNLSHRMLLMSAAAVFAAGMAGAEEKLVKFMVDGTERHAIVFAPSKASGSAPLVLAFHGHGDSADNYVGVDFQKVWPEAVVAYFDGLPARDGLSGWQTEPGMDGDRDLKMVDVALVSLKKTYKIDDARIYASGFSNGGHFTYLLWAQRPNVFAAYGVVAGRIRPTAVPVQPKPLLHIGGKNDHQVAFADQTAAMETSRRINGVSASVTPCTSQIEGTVCSLYATSMNGAPVGTPVMTEVHPGGHAYPEGTSEEIVKFFQRFTLASGKTAAR
jgi:polyhydroxybutyrate depolymerase